MAPPARSGHVDDRERPPGHRLDQVRQGRGGASAIGATMSARHRIAVVDDDHSVRKALRRLLRSAGLDTEMYGSGSEFLETLRASVPDCVVLDLQMPEMSGLELQQHLRNRGLLLPVVIVTGHDEPGMQARCLEAGANAYLRKPIDGRALVEAISRAISEMASRKY
jgi:FixJ family two-component response regulator